MEKESKCLKMDLCLKGIDKKIWQMGMEDSSTQMAISTRVNGKKTKLKVKANTSTWTEQNT